MQLNLSLDDNIEIPKPKEPKRPKGKLLNIMPDNYCVVDIETTGLSTGYDEIIELSAIKVRKNQIADTFSMLIKPKRGVSNFITHLTGISTDMLKDKPDIKEALEAFSIFIEDDIIIGHNIKFDAGFIHYEMKKHFDRNFHNDLVDTLTLARKTYKLPNYKLSTIAKYLNIDTTGAHRGLKDCDSALKVYLDIKNKKATSNI